jgi:DHA3 family macrolide efflux protein-like MFS transporter
MFRFQRPEPNLVRVSAARFISRAGGEAAFFVGIWGKASYDLNSTPGQLALLMGVMGVMALLGTTIGGLLVDRFDPKKVMLYGEIAFVPSAIAPMFADTMGQMTLSIAVLSLFSMIVYTSVASFPPYLTDDDEKLKGINGALESAGNLAFVAGPAIGALIVKFGEIDQIFLFDAVTSLVAAALVLKVSLRDLHADVDLATEGYSKLSAFQEIKEGFKFSYSTRTIRLFITTTAATWVAFGAFGAVEPLYFRDVLDVGPETLGWVNTIFGLGMISGSVLLVKMPERFMTARSVVVGVSLSGLCAVLYAGTADVRVVALGAIVWGAVLGVLFPMSRTLMQRATPDGMYGRVTGTVNVHAHIGELLRLTFVPALAALVGVQAVLVGAGLVLFALSLTRYREANRVDALLPVTHAETIEEAHLTP